MGPFKLDVRKRILSELQALEQETAQQLITESELDVIEDIWRRDQVRQDSRAALHNAITI